MESKGKSEQIWRIRGQLVWFTNSLWPEQNLDTSLTDSLILWLMMFVQEIADKMESRMAGETMCPQSVCCGKRHFEENVRGADRKQTRWIER